MVRESVNEARAEVDRGDYTAALKTVRPLAEHGHAPAQTLLAEMYLAGQGVPPNVDQALILYREAAAQGDGRAENGLGLLYDRGEGVTRDAVEAAAWYQRAADHGYAGGMNNLAASYARGSGLPRDISRSMALYEKAASLGYVLADDNLAARYIAGSDIEQDCAKGLAWYYKAADEGDAQSEYEIGMLYEKAQCLPHDSTKAVEWLLASSEKGYPQAINNLGTLYQDGVGVRTDLPVAFALFAVSARLDDSANNLASANLARIQVDMSPDQIAAGKMLAELLAQPGNFRKALESALRNSINAAASSKPLVGPAPNLVTQTIGVPVAQAHAADVGLPSLIKMGVVEYPDEARQALISGTVVTLTYVGKDGVPTKCIVESQSFVENARDNTGNMVPLDTVYSIVRKDGSIVPLADLFDPPAIKAMMQARFKPSKQAGVAVNSIVRVPVIFGVVQR